MRIDALSLQNSYNFIHRTVEKSSSLKQNKYNDSVLYRISRRELRSDRSIRYSLVDLWVILFLGLI